MESLFFLVLRTFKKPIESLSNYLELVVWKYRQFIFFIGIISLIIIPVIKYYFTVISVGQILPIILILIPYCIFFSIFSNGVTIFSRIFSLIPYFWIWTVLTQNYFKVVNIFLEGQISPNVRAQILDFLKPIFFTINTLPTSSFGISEYLIFALFYFGIARNRDTFPFFIRYHFMQAISLSITLAFEGHIYSFIVKLCSTIPEIWVTLAVIIYITHTIIVLWGVFCVLLGRETNLPLFHEAIQYQIGLKKDENTEPFDRLD